MEVDTLITKKPGSVSIVAVEVKPRAFSTHDVLIDQSDKAQRHFRCPRHGFIIAEFTRINNKFFIHNVGFDFALAFSERPEGRGELVSFVKWQ